ncbi:hypothetical protein V8E36_008126 [Tilletia maclaganii]
MGLLPPPAPASASGSGMNSDHQHQQQWCTSSRPPMTFSRKRRRIRNHALAAVAVLTTAAFASTSTAATAAVLPPSPQPLPALTASSVATSSRVTLDSFHPSLPSSPSSSLIAAQPPQQYNPDPTPLLHPASTIHKQPRSPAAASVAAAAAAAVTSSWTPRERSDLFQRKAIIITSVFLAIFIVLIIGCAVFLRDRKYDISEADLQAEEEEEIRWEEQGLPEHERDRMRQEREEMWIRREMERKDAARNLKAEKRAAKAEARRRRKALKRGIPYIEKTSASDDDNDADHHNARGDGPDGGLDTAQSTALQTRFIAGRWAKNRLQTAIRVIRPSAAARSTSSSLSRSNKPADHLVSSSRSTNLSSIPTTTDPATTVDSADLVGRGSGTDSLPHRTDSGELPSSLSDSITNTSLTSSSAAPAATPVPPPQHGGAAGTATESLGADAPLLPPPTPPPAHPHSLTTTEPPLAGLGLAGSVLGGPTNAASAQQHGEQNGVDDDILARSIDGDGEEVGPPAYIAPPSAAAAAGTGSSSAGPAVSSSSRRADEKRRWAGEEEDDEAEVEARRQAEIERRLFAAGLGEDADRAEGSASHRLAPPPPIVPLASSSAASSGSSGIGGGAASSAEAAAGRIHASAAGGDGGESGRATTQERSALHSAHVATDEKAVLRALDRGRDAPSAPSAMLPSAPPAAAAPQAAGGSATSTETSGNGGGSGRGSEPSAPVLALDPDGFEAFAPLVEEEFGPSGSGSALVSAPSLDAGQDGGSGGGAGYGPASASANGSALPAPPRPHIPGWSEFDEPYRTAAGIPPSQPSLAPSRPPIISRSASQRQPNAPSRSASGRTSSKPSAAEAKAREAGFAQDDENAAAAALLPSRPGQAASHSDSSTANGSAPPLLPQYEAPPPIAVTAPSAPTALDSLAVPSAPPMWEEDEGEEEPAEDDGHGAPTLLLESSSVVVDDDGDGVVRGRGSGSGDQPRARHAPV